MWVCGIVDGAWWHLRCRQVSVAKIGTGLLRLRQGDGTAVQVGRIRVKCSLWTSWTNRGKEERLIGGHMSWTCCAEVISSHCDTLKQKREKRVHVLSDQSFADLLWTRSDPLWFERLKTLVIPMLKMHEETKLVILGEILKSTDGVPDDWVSPLWKKMRVVIHRARYSQLSHEEICPRKKHWLHHWLKIELYSS